MRIAVASGKGGVGKSVVSSSLAVLFSRDFSLQLVDADVDCPDLHLLFPGRDILDEPVYLGKLAEIDFSRCTKCMLCHEKCPFNAIDNQLNIDPIYCEGCGLCVHVCPENAIALKQTLTGHIKKREVHLEFDGDDISFDLVYGELEPGQSTSGKLVDELKKQIGESEIVLVDSAAGVGCPVIASIQGSDLVLLVTEPTPSALDDLARMSDLANHFGVPQVLVINKSDLSPEVKEKIHLFAEDRGIEIIGEIPFHDSVFRAISDGKPVVLTESPVNTHIQEIYNRLLKMLDMEG